MRNLFVAALILVAGVARGQQFVDSFSPLIKTQANVTSVTETPDGNFIVAGRIDYINNEPSGHVIKLKRDGQPDETFQKVFTDFGVDKVRVTPDGKIIIKGLFTRVNGIAANHIARLNADGSVDESFHAPDHFYIGQFELQSDGRVITAPGFTGGSGIYRLNDDGSIDPTFQAGLYVWYALELAVDGDDNVYASTTTTIKRLTADGVLDDTFSVPLLPSNASQGQYQRLGASPDGKLLVAGNFDTLNEKDVQGFVRFNHDGSIDDTFQHQIARGAVNAIAFLANGDILAAGSAGYHKIDASNNQTQLGTFYINDVSTLLLTHDGKVLIAGGFKVANGVAVTAPLALMNGVSVDTSFAPALYQAPQTGAPNLMGITTENQIILGGWDETLMGVGETFRTCVRLDSDGNVDQSFLPEIPANAYVNALEVQDNKGILVSGYLNINGQFKNFIRLTRDGEIDEDFINGSGPDNLVFRIRFNGADIFLGGGFTSYNGVPSQSFIILNHKGEISKTFSGIPQYSIVYDFDFQHDGKIVAIGSFNFPDGYRNLIRLNVDGTLDETFPIFGENYYGALKVDAEDRIYIGGWLYPNALVQRLNPDGSPDETFTQGALLTGNSDFHYVSLIDILPTKEIVIGGNFNEYNGTEANGLLILEKDGTSFSVPSPSLSPSSSIGRLKYHGSHIYVGGKISFNDGEKVIGLGKIKLSADKIEPPKPPTNGHFSAGENGEVRIDWADNSDAEDGYEIEILNPVTGEYELSGLVGANNTALIDTVEFAQGRSSAGEVEVGYRIRAFNAAGASEYVHVTFNLATDVTAAGSDVEKHFSVYPNPASEKVIIRSHAPIRQVTVLNVMGQKVLEVNAVRDNQIDVASLLAGTYTVLVTTDSKTFARMLIKK
jgi:uncharacterized delta-60 repeat protein